MSDSSVILVIEDDAAIRLGLRKSLGFEGYEVHEAADGERGLEMVFERRPDLVVLDLMLPRINGFEVCKRLKSNPALADIPIIFITAHDDVSTRERAQHSGAAAYLCKPFNDELLLDAIRGVVGGDDPQLDQVH